MWITGGDDMNKQLGLVVFVVGIVLLVFGISAADSFGSNMSEFFSGAPSNKAIWLLAAGVILSAVGAFSFFRGNGNK